MVLVFGVHNATDRSLRYAMSLRADELRCLHVQVDEQESERGPRAVARRLSE